jgi:hypothetical protein
MEIDGRPPPAEPGIRVIPSDATGTSCFASSGNDLKLSDVRIDESGVEDISPALLVLVFGAAATCPVHKTTSRIRLLKTLNARL